jgi:hypothetical protein
MLGGGDPAREVEMDAETTEAVSLMSSLPGVSGLVAAETALEATVGTGETRGGTSVFGVATTRSVFGPVLGAGDEATLAEGAGNCGRPDPDSAVDFSVLLEVSPAFDETAHATWVSMAIFF